MAINKTQLVIFGSIGVLVMLAVLLITGIIPGFKPPAPNPFTIEIWGADDPALWHELANNYRESQVKTATINYVRKDPRTYEAELINALASGKGPDIFVLKDSELEKHSDKIKPLGDGLLGYRKKDIKNIFADGVVAAATNEQGELLGTPLFFDTLALFYNRDYFNAANIPTPPQTWDELSEDAKKLTRLSEVGGVQRSGLALGTAANVDHAADIMLALIYQAGGEAVDLKLRRSKINSPATAAALAFYTSFANSTQKSYSWNAFFDNSLAAFARGDAAMAIGYAADVKKIVELNPQLNFDVSPLPQKSAQDPQVNFGRFSLLTVSRLSKEADNAWQFLVWFESSGVQKKYIDAFGLPPARRDLVNSKPPREYLTPFYDQVLSARTFPIAAASSLPEIIENMVNAVINRKFSMNEAMIRAENDINNALRPEL